MAQLKAQETQQDPETRLAAKFYLARRLLHHRFQTVPAAVQTRLQGLPLEQLEQLLDVALSTTTINEFADQSPRTSR
jgi:hypothetical protein